jgi:hypothetical protein
VLVHLEPEERVRPDRFPQPAPAPEPEVAQRTGPLASEPAPRR